MLKAVLSTDLQLNYVKPSMPRPLRCRKGRAAKPWPKLEQLVGAKGVLPYRTAKKFSFVRHGTVLRLCRAASPCNGRFLHKRRRKRPASGTASLCYLWPPFRVVSLMARPLGMVRPAQGRVGDTPLLKVSLTWRLLVRGGLDQQGRLVEAILSNTTSHHNKLRPSALWREIQVRGEC
jgi:hypothetical protein